MYDTATTNPVLVIREKLKIPVTRPFDFELAYKSFEFIRSDTSKIQ